MIDILLMKDTIMRLVWINFLVFILLVIIPEDFSRVKISWSWLLDWIVFFSKKNVIGTSLTVQ